MNPIGRRESVCRSLFGPVDHDQLRRDLKQKLREMTEQDSRRWNFNFHTDTPLPGRFTWEEIPADCAAAVYQEPAQPRDSIPALTEDDGGDNGRLSEREEGAGTDQENCPRISNKCPAEVTPVRRKRSLSKTRSNARITDFFAKRRRTTDNKSILMKPLHTSSSEAALCKTIR
ncbi:cyclin-dependent kinase inhibitor 1B-like [Solea senegalensis]|uniref:Cyclin-dependent kinase inhibitor 1B-like n=1 Tax=Solea senegalensis TaxID=28829 RepID=A0AAV6Q1C2_SOLSE|nr:cyclin-dependent kinase inhibitor 1Ca [Solea senegalensis]KAG7482070.1 cyclin-dependent kinase inhibitor 1B-like [Solea senegalensis]